MENAIIQLGDIDDSQKGRPFKSRFIQAGIAGYPKQFGNVLITKETLDKFVNTLVDKPVIINHKDEIKKEDEVGKVTKVWFNSEDGWFWCEGYLTDETAINLIKDKGWSVSCSYDVLLLDDEGGTENNIKYDKEFLNGRFTHLAIVENPRYERANIVVNSKTEIINNEDDDYEDIRRIHNDRWITVHPNGEDEKGRHLLIQDGEDLKEAMQRQWGVYDKRQAKLKSDDKGKNLYSDENFKYNAKRLNEQFGEKPYSEWQKDVQTMLKKYGKTEEDWDNAIGARKDAFNPDKSDTEPKQEEKKSDDKGVNFDHYTTEELKNAEALYQQNLGSALEYGDEQYKAEKDMLDKIREEIKKRTSEKQPDKSDVDLSKHNTLSGYAINGDYITRNGDIIKKGEPIDASFAGAPNTKDYPKPWVLESAENEFSTVNYKNNTKLKIKSANGNVFELDRADYYAPYSPNKETDINGTVEKGLKEYLKPKKPEAKESSDNPFGEGVKEIAGGRSMSGGKTVGYVKDNKGVSIEDFGDGAYKVNYYYGTTLKEIKYYATEKGMQKSVKGYLQAGESKEAKALETKSNLEEKENTYKEVLKRYQENHRKMWSDGISNAEYYKAAAEAEKAKKELTTARREYAESIMANFEQPEDNPYQDKIDAKRGYYQEKSDDLQKSSERNWQLHEQTRLPLGQPIINPATARAYKRTNGYFDKSLADYNKSKYYAEKANSYGSHGISADDANAIAKLAQKYKSGVTSAEKRRIIDRVIDIHSNRQAASDTSKQTDYSDLGFQVERNADMNRLQLKFNGKPDEKTRSILKSNGFRWSPTQGAWQRQLNGNSEYGLKRVVEGLKKVDNSLTKGIKKIFNSYVPTAEDIPLLQGLIDIFEKNNK